MLPVRGAPMRETGTRRRPELRQPGIPAGGQIPRALLMAAVNLPPGTFYRRMTVTQAGKAPMLPHLLTAVPVNAEISIRPAPAPGPPVRLAGGTPPEWRASPVREPKSG